MTLSQHSGAVGRFVARSADRFLSDESTIELVTRARAGDKNALESILQRSLPQLKHWAHGRLPVAARGLLDTSDLLQEVVLHVLRRLDSFETRHVGAMQAYLRQAVINRIRDEVRRIRRNPAPTELPPDLRSDEPSPLERATRNEAYERYREALAHLPTRDRQLVVARIELEWTRVEIADRFGFRSTDTARVAVKRALERLVQKRRASA